MIVLRRLSNWRIYLFQAAQASIPQTAQTHSTKRKMRMLKSSMADQEFIILMPITSGHISALLGPQEKKAGCHCVVVMAFTSILYLGPSSANRETSFLMRSQSILTLVFYRLIFLA